MNHDLSRRRRHDLVTMLALALVLLAGTATADDVGSARLTAVSGEASLGGEPVDRTSDLGDLAAISTGEDGNAAMLVDEDNLVELCASTKMKLTRHPETGGRVIEVGAGTTRIIVEPGSSDEPLQISTPAAIATILGTVVYVTVDPVTGETTIASEDHPVKIESSDPNVAGSTIINGMETLTMRPGEAPAAEPQKLAKSVLENLSGCLKDIHGDALAFDRARAGENARDRMAAADGEVAELPFVGLGEPPLPPTDPPGERGIEDPADVLEPVDLVEPPGSDEDLPSPCGEIPSDACFPFPDYNPAQGPSTGVSGVLNSLENGTINSVDGGSLTPVRGDSGFGRRAYDLLGTGSQSP